ncbi:hypothetical protein RJ640_008055 [Escallonia rubra]|uniref:Cytochrome P450 n=1 Tax=Escallonia rubra TaxID=112253 RepID=A0AA88UJ10_9ASTE|nr:hypothetical protein RJ640_008055 [Escallonia rubra]
MGTMQTSIVFLCGTLFMYLLFIFIKFLHKVWWTPIQIQQEMSTKEILNKRKESNGKPMELSHNIFPKIQPHLHSWINIYGNNLLFWYGPRAHLLVSEADWLLRSFDDIESEKLEQGIRKSIIRIINKRETTMNGKVDSFGNDFLGLLVKANHDADEGNRITVDDVVDECKTFYTAGHENHHKLAYLDCPFLLLGIRTDWQEKASQEMYTRMARTLLLISGMSFLQWHDATAELVVTDPDQPYSLTFCSRIFKSSDDKESDKLEKHIRDSFLEIIRKIEKSMNKEGSNGMDFLGLLLKARVDTQEISVEGIIDECKTFYAAGHGTTTLLLSWAILLLAINTD